MSIHPTSVVSEKAILGKNVIIGPYCCVGAEVVLEDGVFLHSHVVVEGHTHIGKDSVVFPFASLGKAPQSLSYQGEITSLRIGHNTIIREHATLHRGTAKGGGETVIGSHCFLMVGAHVAHDCMLGDHVVLSNHATLGGHVVLGDHVTLGGLTAVHQFTRIGEGAMLGGFSAIEKDIIPYGMVNGRRGGLAGINARKLRSLHFSREEISALYAAYEWIFSASTDPLMQRMHALPPDLLAFPSVQKVHDFILTATQRPLCLPQDLS